MFYILKISLRGLTLFILGVTVSYRHPMDSWGTPFEPSRSADCNGQQFVQIAPLTVKLFSILKMSLSVLTLVSLVFKIAYSRHMDSCSAPIDLSRSAYS